METFFFVKKGFRTMAIPKKLHMIWVGDEKKRPDEWIQTWRDNHKDWEFKLWGNAEYDEVPWKCKRQMEMFKARDEWCGVADIMRYEILYQYGGLYADADSVSVRTLDDALLDNEMFAVYESEKHAPDLIANGFIGAVAGHIVLHEMIENIRKMKETDMYRWGLHRWKLQKRKIRAWKLTGPKPFTLIIKRHINQVKVLPSVSFIPRHYADKEERVIYARHFYGSTHDVYSAPHEEKANGQ